MATIAVRVGREVKEISGLNKSTTCWDVVLALLKEKQQTSGADNPAGSEKAHGGTEESASNSSASKSIKELAQSYVIVENWRGCEKPIPPRTRILNVWHAWGKEQKHVELSLKKSKHIRYREGNNHHNGRPSVANGDSHATHNDDATPANYLHHLTHHQKKRIRRNLLLHQKAMMQRKDYDDVDDSDDVRNAGGNRRSRSGSNERVLSENARNANSSKPDVKSSDKRNGLTLSEEKFVDGVVTGPDCLIQRADRSQLISEGIFIKEYCKYRRRNHRRLSSVDGVVESRHRRRQVPHFPYSSHHYRRRSSRHGGSRSKGHKCARYRYSTDDTSTTTTTTTNSSEDENAEDADDEKSVLIDITHSIPRRNHPYGVGLTSCSCGSSGTTTTATDSSTTTSGDSMTSSTGCSTSSETSSGGDYQYFPRPRITPSQMKSIKPTQTSSQPSKPKKNKSILTALPNLIKKTNLKRKSAKKANLQSSMKQEETTPQTPDSNTVVDAPCAEVIKVPEQCKEPQAEAGVIVTNDGDKDKIDDVVSVEDAPKQDDKPKEPNEDDEREQEILNELAQIVKSQNSALQDQQNRLLESDAQIEQIENDIHKLRTQAHGKNYVQDAYLSGLMDTDSGSVTALNNLLSAPSTPVSTPWLLACDDVERLEEYIKTCEKIVEMQMKIEEHQRKSDIILQDMQEEIWRVSTDTASRNAPGLGPVTKAAALMLGFNDEDEDSDDEAGHEGLSVTNCSDVSAPEKDLAEDTVHPSVSQAKSKPLPLELERSRTELEASLYLSLRLAAEIDEVDLKLGTSDHLIQAKGERLLKHVRDMATSEDGADPEVWEEYGELLTAYDIEVEQRNYLDILEASHMAVLEAEIGCPWEKEEDTHHYIDATSPNPTSRSVYEEEKLQKEKKIPPPLLPPSECHTPSSITDSPAPSPSLHHALTPWRWCEHCKMEEEVKKVHSHHGCQRQQQQVVRPAKFNQQPPKSFSDLPLPRPLDKNSTPSSNGLKMGLSHSPSVITPTLLPMLPIPDGLMSSPRYNDSDYEDLPDLGTPIAEASKSSVDDSSSNDHQRNRGLPKSLSPNATPNNNADDSGNASAGSTASFASSDGSRNSSCDGGSPRPLPHSSDMNQGSKQLFGRNGVLRGSWKGHFVFPINSKQNASQQTSSCQTTKPLQSPKPAPPPPPPAHLKPKAKKPELPPKMSQVNQVKLREQEVLMQQQKLIRRNSGGRKKNLGVNQLPIGEGKRSQLISNNFAPRGGSFKMPNRLNDIVINSHPSSAPTSPHDILQSKLRGVQSSAVNRTQTSKRCPPPTPSETSAKLNSNYDNDSDTGRSSLHSVDSDQVIFSETLV